MRSAVFPTRPAVDRAAVAAILTVAMGAAWGYLLYGTGLGMSVPDGNGMMQMARPWTPGYAVRVFGMWTAMMAAMMLSAAVRAILRVTNFTRQHPGELGGVRAAALFAAGSFLVWTGFSALATLAQWSLDRAGLLSESMTVRGPGAVGFILLAVGLYQLTPLKDACLTWCRSPLAYRTHSPRGGAPATLGSGVRYGAISLGSCGMLMGLMFVGGAMNTLWIGGLGVLAVAEQVLPWARLASWATGAVFTVGGCVVLAAAAV